MSDGTVSTKQYVKYGDFDFVIIYFPFCDADFPRPTTYGLHISQFIRFARASTGSGHKYFITVRIPIDFSAFFSVQEN